MKARRVWTTLITAWLVLAFGLLAVPQVSLGALISMNTQNEELGKVLKKLSESSGWDVRLVADLETPVSVNFKNKTLDEAISTILQNAGIISHSLVRYADKKEIVIHVFDKSALDSQGNRIKKADGYLSDSANQTTEPQEDKGVTIREVLEAEKMRPPISLDDIVIPPDEEHPNGITLREVREAEKNRPEISLDDVVIPPDEEHPNGMTLGEVREAEKNRPVVSLDDVAIPPDEEHPNGITIREVQEAEQARASAGEDLDQIVIPGLEPDDPGLTLREVLAAKREADNRRLDMDDIVIPPITE